VWDDDNDFMIFMCGFENLDMLFLFISEQMRAGENVDIYTYRCIHIYIHIFMCIFLYMYINKQIYIHINKYIYKYKLIYI